MSRLRSAFWRAILPAMVLILAGIGANELRVLPAWAAGFFTNGVCVAGSTGTSTGTPGVTFCNNSNTYPLTGNEQIPADTQLSGGQAPQSEAITLNQLQQATASFPLGNNFIIGGDAGTNLWQRGTTGSSVTTTTTFGGPDRWFYWSGASTAMTVSQSNTAAQLATGFQQMFRMQRTAAQTGVVQMCMGTEIESVNAFALQGSTVELDFNANTGANFSAAGANMTAYIISGTSTDEGAAKMAFGLNAGGGGGSGWTGQTNATAAVIGLGGVSTNGRYAAVATIPVGAKEVGVALCFTPVGTAGTTDAIYFGGIQLVKSPALAGGGNNKNYVNATTGYSCDNAVNAALQCTNFERRSQAVESVLQYRYYYQITEGAAAADRGMCRSRTTTTCSWNIQFPVVMRVAPTVTYANGFAVETTVAGGTLNNCTLANDTTVGTAAASATNAFALCTATTVPAAGTVDQVYDNGGTGAVKATAEMT